MIPSARLLEAKRQNEYELIDGQQRLTTLFLMHWYAEKKEHIPDAEYEFLQNFSYEIRYSARDFCHDLFSFTLKFPTSEISRYIADCEEQQLYDWRYYFMKYHSFHPDRYGIYLWDDRSKPYEMTVIWAQSQVSVNAYQPFLMEADKGHISKDDFGQQLNYAGKRVISTNEAYVVQLIDKHAEIQRVTIAQNENGVDTEDRIIKGKKLTAKLRASYETC